MTTPRVPFRQADPAWGALEIAPPKDGKPRNLARVGCLVTAIADLAARAGDATITPATLLAKTKAKGANVFYGASAILPLLAKAAGLEAPSERRVYRANGDHVLRAAYREAIEAGDFAILHVDHDQNDSGNHFVGGVSLIGDPTDEEWIVYSDPAVGKEHLLPFSTLTAAALWGGKRFRLVSVAPVLLSTTQKRNAHPSRSFP